jgi:hypothetical protein
MRSSTASRSAAIVTPAPTCSCPPRASMPLQILIPLRNATGQLAQLLGHPQAHIRRPGDQRGVGIRHIPLGQRIGIGGPEDIRLARREPCQRRPVAVIQSGTAALSAASAARMIGA